MIDKEQFKSEIITPVLQRLHLPSRDVAGDLLVGIACVESGLGTYLRQMGGGPALGIYQMEPDTLRDLYRNFLQYKPEIREKLDFFVSKFMTPEQDLVGNLFYATAAARVQLYRFKEPLPKPFEEQPRYDAYVEALARYWKKYWNTHKGAGTQQDFIRKYNNC